MTFLPYNRNLKPFARQLRAELTDTELLLWSHLRMKQLLGIQFYRQKAIGNYIVDFYAPAIKLVIEMDPNTVNLRQLNKIYREILI